MVNLTETDIKIHRIHTLGNDSGLMAFVDIIYNDMLLIKGLRVFKGKNGMFMSMPKEQSKDNRWFEKVRCLNDDVKDAISQKVLAAYEEHAGKMESSEF